MLIVFLCEEVSKKFLLVAGNLNVNDWKFEFGNLNVNDQFEVRETGQQIVADSCLSRFEI